MRTKHTPSFLTRLRLPRWLRLATFGSACAMAAFVIGLETAGDVHPVDTSQAAVQTESMLRVPLKGDIDDDGEVSVRDAQLLLSFVEKLESPTPEQIVSGDVDEDFALTFKDLLRLLHTLSLR